MKTDKDNKYSNEIKSLKYIERVYNDMLEEIKNEKKYYFDNIDENIRKLDEDEVQITNIHKAFKGYAESYEIIIDNKDPLIQLKSTRSHISNHLERRLYVLKGLKHLETLKVTFKK